jgi:2-polyprenyl-6-methoxyphenol hydroxylase-like FAD-dependent oxidoreductase
MAPITVVVVGAGPVGLLTTLRLAQAGIKVKCVEALAAVDHSPRAMAYQPVATKELDRAGVLEDIRKRGGSSGRGICVC